MKKLISIMAIAALMAGVSYGQSSSGGRGTIVKDVSYFDASGNLIVPVLYAGSVVDSSRTEPSSSSLITVGAIAAGQLITTNTITVVDATGAAKTGYTLFRIWVSESEYGAPSTNNIETLSLSTGTAISTEVSNADYWYVTSSSGTAIATITATAAGTNYINVSVGGSVTSEAVVLTSE